MRLTIVKPHGLVILAFVVGLAILSISSMSSAGVITYATSNFTSFMLNESHITNRPAFLSVANSTDQNPVGEIKPLITSGENLSNGYSFPGIPDGLGVLELKMGL